jgi:hypothetical protein
MEASASDFGVSAANEIMIDIISSGSENSDTVRAIFTVVMVCQVCGQLLQEMGRCRTFVLSLRVHHKRFIMHISADCEQSPSLGDHRNKS